MAIIILNTSNVAVDQSAPGRLQDRLAADEQHLKASFHAPLPLYAQIHREMRLGCSQVRDQPQQDDSESIVEVRFLYQTTK